MAKGKKKTWGIIIAVLVVIIIGLTTFLIIDATNKKATTPKTSDKQVMVMLEDEYVIGSNIAYNFYAFSSIQFNKISYSINNGEEQYINKSVTTGLSKDHKNYVDGVSKYYIDTGAQIIETDNMSAGIYHIVFYGYDNNNTRHELNENPYFFKLVASGGIEIPS